MGGTYLSKPWPPFIYDGNEFHLTHLNEYAFSLQDSRGNTRTIIVAFSDHCFTRTPQPGDDPALAYAQSDRKPGHFCLVRYRLSFGIADGIAHATAGKVWTLQADCYAVLPTPIGEYAIVFSLDCISGLPADLHMRVKSAYPIDSHIQTFGSVRFKHLVTLRMEGKHPGRVFGNRRKTPGKKK